MGKPRTRWEDVVRRAIADPRNTRMEEKSRRQRRLERSSAGGQGSAVAELKRSWFVDWLNESGLRLATLTALLLKIQVFWDVTPVDR